MTLLAASLPAAAELREIGPDSTVIDPLLNDNLTREEMVSLYESLAAGGAEAPDCVPGDEMFDDVPASSIFCPWIEELARSGITPAATPTTLFCGEIRHTPRDRVGSVAMLGWLLTTILSRTEKTMELAGRHDFAVRREVG